MYVDFLFCPQQKGQPPFVHLIQHYRQQSTAPPGVKRVRHTHNTDEEFLTIFANSTAQWSLIESIDYLRSNTRMMKQSHAGENQAAAAGDGGVRGVRVAGCV